MKVDFKEISASEVELIFDFAADEVTNIYKSVLNNYRTAVQVPGFRKGRAPISIILRRYGDSIKNDTISRLLKDEYSKALDEYKIEPLKAGEIDYDSIEIKEGEPLQIKVKVLRVPVFEAKGYDELTVEEPELKVDSAEVDNTIARIREQLAQFQPADKAAEVGDVARVSIKAYLNGANIKKLNSDGFEFELGKGQVFAELEDTVRGLKAGEEGSFVKQFPKSDKDKNLAGKDIEYRVKVEEVKERVIPDLDEEFLKRMGDYKDEKEFRKAVEQDILNYKKELAEREAKVQILDQLVAKNEFDIPDILVERELNVMLEEEETRLQRQGLSFDKLNISVSELKERWRKEAEDRARASVILANIARQENIEVTEEDIDAEIERIAKKEGYDPESLKKYIKARPDLSEFKKQVLEQKVINYLYEKAEKKIKKPEKKENQTSEKGTKSTKSKSKTKSAGKSGSKSKSSGGSSSRRSTKKKEENQ